MSEESTLGSSRESLVGHLEITCEAVLGRGTLTIAGLEKLRPGDAVPLDRSPADRVDIRIGGKTVARGEIVTLDDRFAIRITEVGPD
jgi:flagellar motor switch protein FliN